MTDQQAPPKRQFLATWKSGRTPYLKRHYSADQWQAANTARQVNDLTARIRSGKAWIQTIATTDPRYAKWSCELATLRLQCARLQAR